MRSLAADKEELSICPRARGRECEPEGHRILQSAVNVTPADDGSATHSGNTSCLRLSVCMSPQVRVAFFFSCRFFSSIPAPRDFADTPVLLLTIATFLWLLLRSFRAIDVADWHGQHPHGVCLESAEYERDPANRTPPDGFTRLLPCCLISGCFASLMMRSQRLPPGSTAWVQTVWRIPISCPRCKRHLR